MPSPDDTAVLEARNLVKAFGRRPGLRDVSLRVAGPSMVVVTGGNGTGKSTLLRCLAGIARFRGEVLVRGARVQEPASRRAIGYLPQHVGLPPTATVAEVLGLFAALRGVGPDDHPLPAGFVPTADAALGTLSGGQRRRVAIAAALLGSPAVLLLDEPDASLDEAGRLGLWDSLGALRDAGTTILVAAPALGDLGGLADRLVVLDDGRVVDDVVVAPRTTDSPNEVKRCMPS